jgi:hypothetical protein
LGTAHVSVKVWQGSIFNTFSYLLLTILYKHNIISNYAVTELFQKRYGFAMLNKQKAYHQTIFIEGTNIQKLDCLMIIYWNYVLKCDTLNFTWCLMTVYIIMWAISLLLTLTDFRNLGIFLECISYLELRKIAFWVILRHFEECYGFLGYFVSFI